MQGGWTRLATLFGEDKEDGDEGEFVCLKTEGVPD